MSRSNACAPPAYSYSDERAIVVRRPLTLQVETPELEAFLRE